jgi:hypothetical protein
VLTTEPPMRVAAWRHHDARDGFESLFISRSGDGYRCDGDVAAVEDGAAWAIRYSVVVDRSWTTRGAHVSGLSAAGGWDVQLDADGRGGWRLGGVPAPDLDGCLDVDLEASAVTNAFPANRLALEVGAASDAPAAYVRALDLAVERLEQRYERLADDGDRRRYDYASPAFGFTAVIAYGADGLVLDYPGIAVRVA